MKKWPVTVVKQLHTSLYKNDEPNEKFEDLERFESIKRSPDLPMQQLLADPDTVAS